ncbi:MAG: 3-oxoacyl-[acyl-carrier-protein] reductase [Planctomycetota bacterium]
MVDRFSLQDRVAVVTGASRGIGRAVAVELAGAGARVYCVSTKAGGCDDTVAACAAAGGEASAIVADVAQPEQVETMAKTVLGEAGRLDVLVNNAGITKDGVFLRMSDADFDAVLAVNLRGAFLVCRAFARPLMKAGHGRIVNVGSVVGLSGNAGQANYAASKAGLIGLTKSLAQELGSRGVTVNLVAPGFITTDMTASLSDAVRSSLQGRTALGRFGSPDDVAAAVRFLASDAGAYVTGQVLVVDGGLAM